MLIALGCVTLLALSSLATLLYVLRCQREERAQNTVERRELLNRIQAPERIPLPAPETFELPDELPDEIDKVGTISFATTEDEIDAVGTERG